MAPEALAALHALAFTDTPRPWPAAAFAGLLAEPGTILVAEPQGFALGRVAGPEAELLTLAVHPSARRLGNGRRLVTGYEAEAVARGAGESLLEVAATNAAGRALYAGLGYAPVGRRPRYYHTASGITVDAIVMRHDLRENR